MFIKKVEISNYKAFNRPDPIEFHSNGMNIVVGKNNAGKTALLEVLALDFKNDPHKSLHTRPSDNSQVTWSLWYEKEEIRELIGQLLKIPKARSYPAKVALDECIRWLETPGLTQGTYKTDSEGNTEIVQAAFGAYEHDGASRQSKYPYILISYSEEDVPELRGGQTTVSFGETLDMQLFSQAKNRVYLFDSERPRIGQCSHGTSAVLKTDVSNLPEVLDVLGKNPERNRRFNQYVSRVLPMVKWVAVKNLPNNMLEAHIWMIPPDTERDDLTVSLLKSGTGIGQVLAMLYVVFTADTPKVIVIDEPQSFLHPSAIRELIGVFKEFSQHQYIIATHSPLILSIARPCTITQISHNGNEASLVQSDSDEVEAIRTSLDDLGLRVSDVFGFDQVLWVEGVTEEKCFPLILGSFAEETARGLLIRAVKNTGDFAQKKKSRIELVFDIYSRMSDNQPLVPSAVGFLFDRESLSESDREDLQRHSSHPVEFLPYRLYENYLLWPEAIAAVLKSEDTGSNKELTDKTVQQWIEQSKQNDSYLPRGKDPSECDWQEWRKNVHGASLLKDLFRELSENRVEYQKTRHSVLLTKWLIENRKEALKGLGEFLRETISL
jgi:predicted ATPase